jgi:hypothetical protein
MGSGAHVGGGSRAPPTREHRRLVFCDPPACREALPSSPSAEASSLPYVLHGSQSTYTPSGRLARERGDCRSRLQAPFCGRTDAAAYRVLPCTHTPPGPSMPSRNERASIWIEFIPKRSISSERSTTAIHSSLAYGTGSATLLRVPARSHPHDAPVRHRVHDCVAGGIAFIGFPITLISLFERNLVDPLILIHFGWALMPGAFTVNGDRKCPTSGD